MMPEDGRRAGRGSWAAVAVPVVVAALGVAALADGAPNESPYSWPQFAMGASCVAVGAFVAHRRIRHPLGWLFLVAGTAVWCTFSAVPGIAWLMEHRPGWESLTRVLLHIGVSGWIVAQGVMITAVPLAFPSGFLPTWWRRSLLAVGSTAVALWSVAHSMLWTPEYFQGVPATGFRQTLEDWVPSFSRVALAVAVLAMGTMVVSTLRSDRAERRRQAGFTVATTALLLPTLVDLFHNLVHELPQGVMDEITTFQVWALAAAPVVLAVGVLRHQLLDIQVIVRRATLYSALVAVGAAIYLGTVWVVTLVRPGGDVVPAVVGAGIVSVSLGVVRDRLNRVLARRLFGSRDDPFEVLRTLGADLEAAPIQEHALQTVTDTVRTQLRLPYVRVDLLIDDDPVAVAASGDAVGEVDTFPMSYQGVRLGELVVGWRRPGEALTAGERELAGTLARQAGVIAHNVTLVEALRRSRLVLVTAREEERRRIRADLHDGLGPTLATVAMGLEASADRLRGEPDLEALLRDLETELHAAIRDVRTLVYDLRPAALDDLGLVSAVREYARTLARRSSGTEHPLEVVIDAPEGLALPAAVEVAAYRVALEALTNVGRHARARLCEVRMDDHDGLSLSIADDGVGIDGNRNGGIGLRSMRERVTELDGRFTLRPREGGGTEVCAWFPIITPSSAAPA